MIEKKYLAIIGVIIVATIIAALNLNYYSQEFSNNVTIVVEIGVGFAIAVIVYGISRKNEYEIERKLSGVFNIVKENERIQKEKNSKSIIQS